MSNNTREMILEALERMTDRELEAINQQVIEQSLQMLLALILVRSLEQESE